METELNRKIAFNVHYQKLPTKNLIVVLWIIFIAVFSGNCRAEAIADCVDALAELKSDQVDINQIDSLAWLGGPVCDYISYHLIKEKIQSEGVAEALLLCEKHLEQYPFSRFSPAVRLIFAEGLNQNGKFQKAKDQLERFRMENPEWEQGRALTQLGIAFGGLKKISEAQKALSEAIFIYGYQGCEMQARKVAKSLGGNIPLTRQELVDLADEEFRRGNFISCQRLCNTYIGLYSGLNSLHMRMKAVDCLLERKRRGEARALLKKIEPIIPKTAEAQAAMDVRWARAERGRDFRGKPRTSYYEVIQKYPKTEGALLARYFLGFHQYDSYKFEPAVKNLSLFLKDWKHSEYRDEAFWFAGFSCYLGKKYENSIGYFTSFIKAYPDHKDLDRALYWRARSYEHLNNKQEAEADYQSLANRFFGTYYGLAAQVRLESTGIPMFSFQELLTEQVPWEHFLPLYPVPWLSRSWAQANGGGKLLTDNVKESFESFARFANPQIRRPVANFYALFLKGRTDLAWEEANYLFQFQQEMPYVTYLTGVMYSLLGENLKSIIAANKGAAQVRQGELFDPYRLNARRQFPLLYFDLIEENGKKHGVDPFLMIALAKQESAFMVETTSWAKAAGLFQIMPGTGKWIARKREIKDFKISDLYNPVISADFGVWYFARLLKNNDKDVIKSLAGYNAGGLNADRWWNANPNRENDEMIELIGYSETRNYVKLILRNWEMYQRLYLDPYALDFTRESVFGRIMDPVPQPLTPAADGG